MTKADLIQDFLSGMSLEISFLFPSPCFLEERFPNPHLFFWSGHHDGYLLFPVLLWRCWAVQWVCCQGPVGHSDGRTSDLCENTALGQQLPEGSGAAGGWEGRGYCGPIEQQNVQAMLLQTPGPSWCR